MLLLIRRIGQVVRLYLPYVMLALSLSSSLVGSQRPLALPVAETVIPIPIPALPIVLAPPEITNPTATPSPLTAQSTEADRDALRHDSIVLRSSSSPRMIEALTPETPASLSADATAEAVAAPVPLSSHLVLENVGEIVQTLNNCGPASVAMILAYYGRSVSQAEAESVLKPDPEAWGMLPNGVPGYVKDFGLDSRVLEGGTVDSLKALLQQGVPVIVAQWLSSTEPIPHYRVVIGYDDPSETFLVNDGVLGFHHPLAYADFVSLWDVYNNLYLPVFRREDSQHVQRLLAEGWNRTVTYVALAHSRPGWDALLSAGMPLAAVEPTPEAIETPRPPNTIADAAWPLARTSTEQGHIIGSAAGAFAFFTVTVDEPGSWLRVHYTPDDPIIGRGFGFKVYDAQGKVVGEGVNTTGQVGTRQVDLPTTPGTYLVQVYNYLPNVQIEFELTWS